MRCLGLFLTRPKSRGLSFVLRLLLGVAVSVCNPPFALSENGLQKTANSITYQIKMPSAALYQRYQRSIGQKHSSLPSVRNMRNGA